MNKIKKLLKAIILLIGATLIPIILFYGVIVFKLYIGFERPDLTYDGDKTVLEEDVIYYEKITLRDLRLDYIETNKYNGERKCCKYFLVKGRHFSLKKLDEQLSKYCFDYFDSQNEYDEIHFHFYEESGTMPWFWNNEGYFPDLEYNSDNEIITYRINKGGIIGHWLKGVGGYSNRNLPNGIDET